MTYLMCTPNVPQTIEFRQAKGSLSGADINHWIDVCIGLVRLAHLYVADPERNRVRSWGDVRFEDGRWEMDGVSAFDLMKDMELSPEVVRYWEGRVASFACFARGDEYDRLDNEVPPEEGAVRLRGSAGVSQGKKRPGDNDGDDEDEDETDEGRKDNKKAKVSFNFHSSISEPDF